MYSDDNQYDSDDDFKLTPSLPSQVDQPKDDLPKIESNANATSAQTEDTPVNSGCAIPIMTNRQCRLEYKDLDKLIGSANAERLINKPSPCPKGGDVYLFPYSSKEDKTFLCDCFNWVNDGVRKLPRSNPKYSATHYAVACDRNSEAKKKFKRMEYRQIKTPVDEKLHVGVVHYVGDEKYGVKRKHYNSNSDRVFIRNAPVIKKLVEVELQRDPNLTASQLYQKIRTDNPAPPGLEAIVHARDRKQMSNFKYVIQNKFRPTKDAIYNLNTFIRENERQFILSIEQTPQDFLVSCMLPDTPEIINELITEYPNEPFVVLYDTTFELGEFYASVLIYRQKSLTKQPVFPLAVLIHEKKFRENHRRFVKKIFRQLPIRITNGTVKTVLITDREFDFRNLTPNMIHVYCWRHLIDNVTRKITDLVPKNNDMRVDIVSDMYSILKSDSEKLAALKAEELSEKWPEKFKQYYFSSIAPAVRTSGKWVLEPVGIYSSFSGITTNASESFNRVLKSWNSWREMPIDVAVLAFHTLFNYYNVDYDRAKYGLGDFKLNDHIPLRPANEMPKRDVIEPGKVLQYCRFGQVYVQPQKEEPKLDQRGDADSNFRIGQFLVENGKVVHDTLSRCFNVTENGQVYLVRFNPTSCGCGDKACAHLIAARLSCNLPVNVKANRNITTLRRADKRKISKSKLGRKRPRKDDFTNVKPKITDVEFDDEDDEPANTQVDTATCYKNVEIRQPANKQVETATCVDDVKIQKPATKDLHFDTQVDTATCAYDSQTDAVEKNNSDFTNCRGHSEETTNCAYDAGRLNAKHLERIEEECESLFDKIGNASPPNFNSQATVLVESQSKTTVALNTKRETTIIIDSQIPTCDEIEDTDLILEMRQKPPMDLSTLITNNLSNLEPEEDEEILDRLSDVDDDALLNVSLKSKDAKPTFCECQVDKTVNRMLECDAQVAENCRMWYHPDCENISEVYFSLKNNRRKPENKFYWECTHCFVIHYFRNSPTVQKYQLQNTCTIDPGLTTFYIKAKFCPKFLRQLPIELSMLTKSMTLALEHQFGEAALEWVNYIRYQKNAVQEKNITKDGSGTKIDLYGAADEFFLSHINTLYTLQRRSECSVAKCPMRINTQEITGYALTIKDKTIENLANKHLRKHKQICGQRHENGSTKCPGIRTYFAPTFTMQQLLMLPPIYLCNAPFNDVFALPTELTFNRRRYHLLSVIVYNSNHFACIVLRPGTSSKEYYLCDDLQEKMVRVEEGSANGHVLQYALYFLDC